MMAECVCFTANQGAQGTAITTVGSASVNLVALRMDQKLVTAATAFSKVPYISQKKGERILLKMANALVLGALLCCAMAGEAGAQSVVLSAQGLTKEGTPGGPIGQALAVIPSTPRNGTAVEPHQVDTTFFKERVLSSWQNCGSSIASGYHKAGELITQLASKGQIAQALSPGKLSMVLHQIKGSGNGPYWCAVDSTATAQKGSFKDKGIAISMQVPGNSPTANAVLTTQFPLIVDLPSDLQCTGSFTLADGTVKKNICLLRCQNNSTNGPYGACIPFELVKTL